MFKSRNATLGFIIVLRVGFTERIGLVVADEAINTQIAINLDEYKLGWIMCSCNIEA